MLDVYQTGLGLGANYVTAPGESEPWGIGSFASWGVAALIAAAGAAIWTWLTRKSTRTEYTELNYWLRLAARHWAALLSNHLRLLQGVSHADAISFDFKSAYSFGGACRLPPLLAGRRNRHMV
jgi:hypothetical protein